MTVNALLNLGQETQAKFDLVGPTVDDDIRRIITRYGPDAVKEAIKRQTKPRRGRRPEKDFPELREVFLSDANDWLSGGDPFSTRSIYSIAKSFADEKPGHSHPATMKRIERKLGKSRVWITLAHAERIGRSGAPYSAYLRTLQALIEHMTGEAWSWLLDDALATLADYEAKFGAPVPNNLSIEQIKTACRTQMISPDVLKALSPNSTLGGLFGLAGTSSPNSIGDQQD